MQHSFITAVRICYMKAWLSNPFQNLNAQIRKDVS